MWRPHIIRTLNQLLWIQFSQNQSTRPNFALHCLNIAPFKWKIFRTIDFSFPAFSRVEKKSMIRLSTVTRQTQSPKKRDHFSRGRGVFGTMSETRKFRECNFSSNLALMRIWDVNFGAIYIFLDSRQAVPQFFSTLGHCYRCLRYCQPRTRRFCGTVRSPWWRSCAVNACGPRLCRNYEE